MPDRHTICNLALGWLGVDPIQSFDDRTDQAAACRSTYEPAVEVILEDHDWRFAERVVRLAPDATPFRADFLHSYQVPTDWLATRGLLDDGGRPCRRPWRMSADKVCTDEPLIQLVYTFRAPEQSWSAFFVQSLAYLLASQMAYGLTEDQGKTDVNMKLHLLWLARARSRDSQQDSPGEVDTSGLLRWHAG